MSLGQDGIDLAKDGTMFDIVEYIEEYIYSNPQSVFK